MAQKGIKTWTWKGEDGVEGSMWRQKSGERVNEFVWTRKGERVIRLSK